MSEGIKAQYQILADVKRVDEKIGRLQSEAEHIPAELKKIEGALKARRDSFEKIKTVFEASEKNLRKFEQELRAKEDSLHKAEGKMMEVKTNEEYQAAMKENDAQKTDKSSLEDQVLKLFTEVESQKKQFKEAEAGLKSYEASIQDDRKKLEDEINRVTGLIRTQEEQRTQLTAQLPPEVSALYERISSRIPHAVVSVDNGLCLGCNMKIRPQLYNEVIGYKLLHRCPTCGRILISSPQEAGGSDAEQVAMK